MLSISSSLRLNSQTGSWNITPRPCRCLRSLVLRVSSWPLCTRASSASPLCNLARLSSEPLLRTSSSSKPCLASSALSFSPKAL
ncbi:hypothetical protein D3C76_1100740 [compost metagenome]